MAKRQQTIKGVRMYDLLPTSTQIRIKLLRRKYESRERAMKRRELLDKAWRFLGFLVSRVVTE